MANTDDVQALFGRRMTEYQRIWEDATARMLTGNYRSEDLIEDWFSWWGRAARDMTAATTLAFGQFSAAGPGMGAAAGTGSTPDETEGAEADGSGPTPADS